MILRGSVLSYVLGMETGITVVTPSMIKEEGGYKVVYLLHGLFGCNADWTNYSMLPVFAAEHDIIFVMPEVARSFYTDMKFGQKFFTYITDELPVICKSIFNISSKREDTAVIGASMGGYGALKCALTKPEQYGYCAAFSSACLFLKEGMDHQRANGKTKEFNTLIGERLINDFESAFGEELQWTPEIEIMELAKRVDEGPVKPVIYATCGTSDSLYAENIRFRDEMEKLSLSFTFEEWEGKHDWYYFNEALRRSLMRYF